MTSAIAGFKLWAGAIETARRKKGVGSEYDCIAFEMCRCCRAPNWCSVVIGLGIPQSADLFGVTQTWRDLLTVVVGSGELTAGEPQEGQG